MGILRCATAEELVPVLESLARFRGSALLLFFGSEDPTSGVSWCQDCITADPVLRAACCRLRPELTLYECPVGMRSQWKDHPQHPYRQHALLHLQRIPTLILVEEGCERGRLVEGDCAQGDLVAAFLRPGTIAGR